MNRQRKGSGLLFLWVTAFVVGLYLFCWKAFPHISKAIAGGKVPLPMPSTAFALYMLIALFGAFLYVTSEPGRLREFLSPLLAFLRAKGSLGMVRLGVFVLTPLVFGGALFTHLTREVSSPTGIRIQHPTMPGRFERLDNPFRNPSDEQVQKFIEKTGLSGVSLEEARAKLIERYTREGTILYEKNCRPCHGVAGGGDGPMARPLPLKPANFRDPGTIATVVEPYAFWRVNEGGRGLPTAATPWDSAMPVWKRDLKPEEMWKILLGEYEISQVSPRVPEKLE